MNGMELEAVVKNIDRRLSNIEQILPTLATKDDLKAFPTREDLRRGLEDQASRMRQHFEAVAERVESHVRLVAEGHAGLLERLEDTNRRYDRAIASLDLRVTRLEVR